MIFDPMVKQEVDRLRPLWLALHAHHRKIASKIGPFVSEEMSWHCRKSQYLKAMTGDFFGLIAREGSADIGYLLCARRPMDWNATFAIPSTLWELVTLFVVPELRGRGLGSTLLDVMDKHVASSDVQTKLIGVIPDNHQAVALYQSRGFVPSWLTQTRFQRPAPKTGKASGAILIETNGAETAVDLEPLWLSLHHHHQAVSPHLGPWVNDQLSWGVIRDLLAKSASNGLLFVAKENGKYLGLASVAIYNRKDIPNWSDTWMIDEQVAETKFLVVSAEARGRGIGSALMDAVDRELATRNVRDHLIGAIEPNRSAVGFYESRGFRPAWLEMVKL